MSYKIFSFFAGAGFLDLGFETAGYQIAYVNEYFSPFIHAYKYSREELGIQEPEHGFYNGSVTDFYQLELNATLSRLVSKSRADGSLVGFIGGPPCPDFSIAGKNRGHLGENGKLSQTYIDLITKHKPDFFLFENVKGLWRTAKHKAFFDKLKAQLRRAGYKLTERLINSIEYGVPQDRERIILLGFRNNIVTDNKKVTFPWTESLEYPERTAFDFDWVLTEPFLENSERLCPHNVPQNLTVEHWFRRNNVLNHLNAQNYFQPRAGLARFLTIAEGDDSKKSFKRLHRWRYSPTAAYGNNEVHLHPYLPRRISAAEALAIQSLPKDFVLPPDMTLSNMFKTIGNGVPYLAAYILARTIKTFLEEQLLGQNNSIKHSESNFATATKSRL